MAGKRDRREYYKDNKEKILAQSTAWQLDNKEAKKNIHLKHRYGISLEQYNKMFDDQKGCCACCGKHQTELKQALNIDHDHTTEIIRGLLCWSCNVGIGKLGDNLEGILKAVKYLENA